VIHGGQPATRRIYRSALRYRDGDPSRTAFAHPPVLTGLRPSSLQGAATAREQSIRFTWIRRVRNLWITPKKLMKAPAPMPVRVRGEEGEFCVTEGSRNFVGYFERNYRLEDHEPAGMMKENWKRRVLVFQWMFGRFGYYTFSVHRGERRAVTSPRAIRTGNFVRRPGRFRATIPGVSE